MQDTIYDIEKSNEALDTLLSSHSLQSDFLLRAQHCLRLFDLAQPCTVDTEIEAQLHKLRQLEKHVRALSPAFLSDQIDDGQSDDSFLLKDIAGTKQLSIELIADYIKLQRNLRRAHLANALERQLGFVRI